MYLTRGPSDAASSNTRELAGGLSPRGQSASHIFRLPHQLSLNWSLQICLSSTTGQKGPRLEPQVGFHFAFNCRESINTGTFSETFKVYRLLIFFFFVQRN